MRDSAFLWNIFLKAGTNFENIDEKLCEKSFFVPEIWSSKVFEKYAFPDLGKCCSSQKEYSPWVSTVFFQNPYVSVI